ncbi:MAG: penicillin-binding protein 2 [Micrococcales bacterium]|nr:penicillin-binding protein 2 [Micrococcales bacterium]
MIAQPASRQRLLRVTLLFVVIALLTKLVLIQVVNADAVAAKGLKTRMEIGHSTEAARRGSIVTSDGTVLATDFLRYRVEIYRPEVRKLLAPDQVHEGLQQHAAKLAPVIGVTPEEALDLLEGETDWVPLFDTQPPSNAILGPNKIQVPIGAPIAQGLWAKIEDLNIPGISARVYYQRNYPAGTLAGNLVGFPFKGEDDDEVPTHFTGIEASENEALQGTDGEQWVESGLGGQAIPGGVTDIHPAKPGCDVRLTLDADLQHRAQAAINKQVKAMEAKSGMVVVLDTLTGEILALADSGTVNPEKAREAGRSGNSRAVLDAFEPGSTGKVITMAMVLQSGEATPTTGFVVPWIQEFRGQLIKDHDEHGTSQWTLNGILAQSSNVGTVLAAGGIPIATRLDFLKKFGVGTPTGVELAGENPGSLPKPMAGTDQFDDLTRNVLLFGQAYNVNALQATGVYATIANDGVSVPIHLVKSIECPDQPLTTPTREEGRRVISAETAHTLRDMLESVVDEGTGQTAQITGYRVAGKTGTAEHWSKGERDGYITSFIGFAPAEAPRIAVGVIMVKPELGNQWGSTTAGPVFKEVAAFALQRLTVPPSTGKPPDLPTTW